MERKAKFMHAVETAALATYEVQASEMATKDFPSIKQAILDEYSNPPFGDLTTSILEQEGYKQILSSQGFIFKGEYDTFTFDEDGKITEHWEWPDGRDKKHLSYTLFDEDGYVVVEEDRKYSEVKDSPNRSLGSRRKTFEYDYVDGRKMPTKVKYRNIKVTESLHTSESLYHHKVSVIDLKAPPKRHHFSVVKII